VKHEGTRRKKQYPNLPDEKSLGFQKGLAAAVFALLKRVFTFFFFHQ
jgi:hypothetical protein